MEHKMPEAQKKLLRNATDAALCDFQLRLQLECGLTAQEACDYIAQAFEDKE